MRSVPTEGRDGAMYCLLKSAIIAASDFELCKLIFRHTSAATVRSNLVLLWEVDQWWKALSIHIEPRRAKTFLPEVAGRCSGTCQQLGRAHLNARSILIGR